MAKEKAEMEYPLINREVLQYLKIGHGLFNFSVMLIFFYTARLGLGIRQARKQSKPPPITVVRLHRKLGPFLAGAGVLGFVAGVALVLLDTGEILKYPAHLLVGATIVALLITTFLVSKKIKGKDNPYRLPHFLSGLAILSLYSVEFLLGLGALF